MKKLTWRAPMAAALILLAACGDSDDTSNDTDASATNQTGAEADAPLAADPDATPAGEVPDAALAEGSFELLDAEGSASGTASLARSDAGSTLTVTAEGLEGGGDYVAHLHTGLCFEGGGAAYQADEGSMGMTMTADDQGRAEASISLDRVAGPEGISVLMAAASEPDTALACADLVDQEGGPGMLISEEWIRTPAGGQTVAAGYLVVDNRTETDRVIVAAESPVGAVELHESQMRDDGSMTMVEQTEGIGVEAFGRTVFRRGGLHLMFLDVELTEGQEVPVTLTLDDDSTIDLLLTVQGDSPFPDPMMDMDGDMDDMDDMDHSDMDMDGDMDDMDDMDHSDMDMDDSDS